MFCGRSKFTRNAVHTLYLLLWTQAIWSNFSLRYVFCATPRIGPTSKTESHLGQVAKKKSRAVHLNNNNNNNNNNNTMWHNAQCSSTPKIRLLYLTFIGPCIVIYFYSKTNEMHQFFNFILFCSSTLCVSDGLSVHHQESKTVHTASGIRQTDSADCLLAGTRWNWYLPDPSPSR